MTKCECPLCGAKATGTKVEDRREFWFEAHGDCGRFRAGDDAMRRAHELSLHARRAVQAQIHGRNARGETPDLWPLL